jgi:hypothetical protein
MWLFSRQFINEIMEPKHKNLVVVGCAADVTLVGRHVGDDHEVLVKWAVIGNFGWLELSNSAMLAIHK